MPMARGASLNIAGMACTKLVLLAITAILSWGLGASAVGRFAQAYALLMVLVALAELPFGNGTARFVAMHRADGDAGALRGAVRLGVGGTVVCAAVLAGLVCGLAPWAAHRVFHDAGLVTPLRLVAGSLLPFALADAALTATVGLSRMRPNAVIKLILQPVVWLGVMVVLMALGAGLTGAMVALVVSSVIAAVLALRALRRYLGPATHSPVYRPRALCMFSLVSGTAWLATLGLVWADTLILGALGSSTEVGVYTVATRAVVLATFVLPASTQAFAPRITDLYERGQTGELQHAYQVVTGWNLTLSLPMFALLVAFPEELLALFGHGYSTAVTVTMVLVAGQLVNAVTGPAGMMLTMSGRPGWGLADNVVTLALNVVLNLALIPAYGIVGAAIAWSVSLSVVNVVRVVQIRVALGMLPFQPRQLQDVFAATGAAVCGLLVALPFSGLARLAVGGITVLVAYLVAIAMLHRGDEDRLVVRMLVHRTATILRPQWRQT